MNIKNFRLKTKKNYKKVNYSSFDNENCFYDYVAKELSNGVDIIELQAEKLTSNQFLNIAKRTRELCSIYDALFFIYDRCDIAFLSEADGIVLSEKSISLENAKCILGEQFMFGYLIEKNKKQNKMFDFFVSKNPVDNSISEIPSFKR